MSVLSNQDLKSTLNELISTLRKIHERSVERSAILRHDNVIIQTNIQSIFSLKFDNEYKMSLYQLILSWALNAEKSASGAFNIFIELISRGDIINLPRESLSCLEKTLTSLETSRVHHPTLSDLNTTLNGILNTQNLRSMFDMTLELAGFNGKILIEKSNNLFESIEHTNGFRFGVKPSFKTNTNYVLPYVVCIDGYIESVGEIHHLLQQISEKNANVLMFVRGLSNDVLNTLKVNFDRGLTIIPIIVPFDLEGINMLNDIAIVSGGDVVSTTKGQLISAIKFDEFKQIDKCIIHDRGIILNSSVKVETHISHIKEKRDNLSDEHLRKLYDKRIQSLTHNLVTVRLIDDNDFVTKSQTFDYALRAIKTLLDYGVHGDKREPLGPVLHAHINAIKCIKSLSHLGAVVIT